MASKLQRARGSVMGTALLSLVLAGGAAAQDDDEPRIARPCLNNPTIKRTRVLNDRNIVFVTRDDEIYNNQLPRQCPSLRRGSIVNYPVVNNRLCAGNTFTVLWQTGANNFVPAFVCPLGNFVPITEDELADLMAMTGDAPSRRERRRNRDAIRAEPVKLPPAEAPTPAP